jgi:uncharacterized protein (DUF934 family)
MPIVIDQRAIIEDPWIIYDGQQTVNRVGRLIVKLAYLLDNWKQLESADFSLGVELVVTDRVEDIETCLTRLELVVLNFDAFSDGRAFSQARILRERFLFHGDIRAQGQVVRDQLSFMQRCGINQFCLTDGEEANQALYAFSEISTAYQVELEQWDRH